MAASSEAVASGERVEIDALTDEYSKTYALADGTFELEMTVVPVRVQEDDGSWAPVDPVLESAGSRIEPKASPVGLSLSNGGSGVKAISLERDGESISLDWPGSLPKPTLDGATATYADVLPDVDLLLTATDAGYRQVLRVETPEAAANPALNQLRFAVTSTDLRLVPNQAGGFDAFDHDGEKVYAAPQPIMWDSSGDAAPVIGSPSTHSEDPTEPEFEAPSASDEIRVMPVKASAQAVVVTPDQKLLDDPATTYPVYIDPSLELGLAERIMVGSNGEHDYAFSGDEGIGRCDGACPRTVPAPYIKRMFFEFSNAKLSGKKVLNATFRAYETWSYSCTPSWVRISRTSGNISSGTVWPGPSAVDQLGDRSVAAGRGTACSPAQNDKWIEFNDNPSESDENLTATIAAFAAGSYGARMTIALWASNEAETNSWKRFRNDAALSVQYMWNPGITDNVGVLTTTDPASRKCAGTEAAPTVVPNPRPQMTARIHTANTPTSSEDQGLLKALFRLDHKKPDGTWEVLWPSSGTLTGKAVPDVFKPNGYVATTTTISNLLEANLYRVLVRTWSHGTNTETGASVEAYGAWNGTWCHFIIDTTGALAPTVTSTDLSPCLTNDCPDNFQPGATGHLTFATAEKNVERFRWKIDGVLQADTPLVATPTAAGLTQTVALTLPGAGEHVVEAAAVEAVTHKASVSWTPFRFKVGPPPPEIGTWRVEESPGATTAADSSGVTTPHHLTLAGSAAVDPRGRRENAVDANGADAEDSSLSFPGSVGAIASTSTPVIDTGKSFTISTWAYLRDSTVDSTVLSQTTVDARSAGIALRWNASTQRWDFDWHYVASGASTPTRTSATSNSAGQPVNVWTHLTGVYDADTDQLQLWVNGRPQTPMDGVVTEPTTGVFTVGAGRYSSTGLSEPYNGLVDEIHVSPRALGPDEALSASGELMPENGEPALALVGSWVPNESAVGSTSLQDLSPYLRSPLALKEGSTVGNFEAESFITLDGVDDYATTPTAVLDETSSFTVSTTVALNPTSVNAAEVGSQARVAGQRSSDGSSWAVWYHKTSATAGQWKFGRWSADGTQSVAATDYLPANIAINVPVHVTGVYDAVAGTVRIYVENEDRDNQSLDFFSQGAGELTVGRGLRSGTWGDQLGGRLHGLRIWAGAMSQNQVVNNIVGH